MAPKIEHLVVLMMENRSFDHMFGLMKDASWPIDGLNGNETIVCLKALGEQIQSDGFVRKVRLEHQPIYTQPTRLCVQQSFVTAANNRPAKRLHPVRQDFLRAVPSGIHNF